MSHLYETPLSSRYASQEISYLFSPRFRAISYRKLWLSLAKAQKELGLSISKEQIDEMEKELETIDFDAIDQFEKRFFHDVMAHIHAFSLLCPKAKPIIHLGSTSCFVTDNSDLIQIKEALFLLLQKLNLFCEKLAHLAEKEKDSYCLGYTHYQSAQPTTIGKRIALWLQDFFFDLQDWYRLYQDLSFLGAKGATGTQSSFLLLFQGNEEKVLEMEKKIAASFGFSKVLPLSGQTYTRKIDTNLFNAFSSFAASSHKMATDLRLLAHDKEWQESFRKEQVGSSAMPYKKNPIYAERVCGLSRFVISLSQNASYTLATQWLERTLDDSSNRRITLPEVFLSVDAILNLLLHLVENSSPIRNVSLERLQKELPLLVTENLLMASVQKGGDRQDLHEKLKKLCHTVSLEDLLKEIAKDSSFFLTSEEIQKLTSLKTLTGRASSQVTTFLKEEFYPFVEKAKISHPSLHPIQK